MLLHETPAIAAGIDHLIATVPQFAKADRARFGWRKSEAGFAGILQIILAQQVSTSAAASMWTKLTAALPKVEAAPFLALDDAALAKIGFSRQKMRYARTLAEALISGRLDLGRLAEAKDDDIAAALMELPGIGPWSAQGYLMFCLARPDIWPAGDLGIILGTQYLLGLPEKPKPATVIEAGEAWRPHRSAAALLIWDYYMQAVLARRLAAKAEQGSAKKRSQR